MIIQRPTPGRVVHYKAFDGNVYPAIVVRENVVGEGRVDIVYFRADVGMLISDASAIFEIGIRHSVNGEAGSWRYPPRSDETIEVWS